MPIKFISSIILIAIVGIFCGFNWGEESQCSINLIFYKTPEIPVFLTIIVSFLAGMVVMALFSLFSRNKKSAPAQKSEAPKTEKAAAESKSETKTAENAEPAKPAATADSEKTTVNLSDAK